MRMSKNIALGVTLAGAVALGACAKVEITPPHKAPLPTQARMLLGKKGMTEQQPIFIRIFKAESELEIWKQREDGYYHLFKSYPICHWSGELGPKRRQGDKQAPEGFYTVNKYQLNPNSKFHLSFDLGYPNAFDQAHDRTGDFLMVHGKCKSAGCYAMTDAIMEEIYALAREAFAGGQEKFHVHAFPFRMTDENMARYINVKGQGRNPNLPFWQTLKQAYDYFEITRKAPNIEVCDRRYNVNVEWEGDRLDPRGACPRFRSGPIEPYTAVASFSQSVQTVPAPRPAERPPAFQPSMNLLPRSTPAPARTDDPIGRLIRQLAH